MVEICRKTRKISLFACKITNFPDKHVRGRFTVYFYSKGNNLAWNYLVLEAHPGFLRPIDFLRPYANCVFRKFREERRTVVPPPKSWIIVRGISIIAGVSNLIPLLYTYLNSISIHFPDLHLSISNSCPDAETVRSYSDPFSQSSLICS